MDWLRENWFWAVFGVLFLWMHTKMHGGHGGHSGHGGRRSHCGGGGSSPRDSEDPHAQH